MMETAYATMPPQAGMYKTVPHLLSLKLSRRSATMKTRLKLLLGSQVGSGRMSYSMLWCAMYYKAQRTTMSATCAAGSYESG